MGYKTLQKSIFIHRNFHLLTSIVIVFTVSLFYGFGKVELWTKIFDFEGFTIDLSHVFSAIMGLYLGMVAFWMMGVLNQTYWRAASWCLVFFMGGLAAGRICSMMISGIPSFPFCIGLVIELALAFWSWHNIRAYPQIS